MNYVAVNRGKVAGRKVSDELGKQLSLDSRTEIVTGAAPLAGHVPDSPEERSMLQSISLDSVSDEAAGYVSNEQLEAWADIADVLSIVTVLRTLATDSGRVMRCCDYLATSISADRWTAFKQQTAFDNGVIQQTLYAIMQHASVVAVHAVCCELLEILANGVPAASARVAELKGIQLVIHSMLLHKEQAEVQIHAMCALIALMPSVKNRETIGQFFGMEVVVSAMRMFPEKSTLQTHGANFLGLMGVGMPKNRAVIVKCGGFKAILRAMKHNRCDEVMMGNCIMALRNLAKGDEELSDLVGRLGAVKLIISGLILFKDSQRVQTLGCECLAVLCLENVENTKRYADLCGVESVLRAMRCFRNEPSIHQSSISLMNATGKLGSTYAANVVTCGVLDAVLGSMIEFRRCAPIQRSAIELLFRFARLSDDIKKRIVAAGGIEAISKALKAHITNERLVEDGVRALRFMRKA